MFRAAERVRAASCFSRSLLHAKSLAFSRGLLACEFGRTTVAPLPGRRGALRALSAKPTADSKPTPKGSRASSQTTAPRSRDLGDVDDTWSQMNIKHAGGIPDFVEKWSPAIFHKVGLGLTVASLALFPLSYHHGSGHLDVILPGTLSAFTAFYWWRGLSDMRQSHQALRRNFPFLIHIRYLLESIRPEIQQYLIESDSAAVPFSREMRTVSPPPLQWHAASCDPLPASGALVHVLS